MWNRILDEKYYTAYGIILGLVVLSLLAGFLVKLLWRLVLLPLARRQPGRLNALILERTEKAFAYLVPVAALHFTYLAALELLDIDLNAHVVTVAGSGVFYVLLALLGSWAGYGICMAVIEWLLRDMSQRTGGDTMASTQFAPIIARVLKVVVFGIALLVILDHFKVQISGFLVTAGVASLAVALAAQDTIANMISGFVLVTDRSFRPGDRLKLANGVMGDVIDIGLRATRLLTPDESVVIVPNSELAKSQIVNYHYPSPRYKIIQTLGVAYGSDMAKVKRVLLDIVADDPGVLKDPAPELYFMEFADSSLNVQLKYCVASHAAHYAVLDRVNTEIQRRFEAEKIEIPFPQRDIHIRNTAEPSHG